MFLIISLVLLSIVLVARIASRLSIPLVVISLVAGIIFGSDVTGLIYFDDAFLAKQVADFALIFILFIAGFGTKKQRLRSIFAPAMALSTLGVAITAFVTALLLYLLLDLSPSNSILIGCIIASTDAAAVFSILRSRSLNDELSAIVEVESATNDPMAIILTSIAVQLIVFRLNSPLTLVFSLVWQLLGGIGIGLFTGFLGVSLFKFVKTLDKGYFYIFMISIIMLSYGAATLAESSGVLSAFFAGYWMGNASIPYKSTLSTLLEALSTIANVVIFVLLGLLVFPHEFKLIYAGGFILFLILTFVARPLSVFLGTLFTKYTIKEKLFLSWSGLRGAVPIVLATYPAAAGIMDSRGIFNIVFFAVLLSMMVQGSTIGKVADWLKLAVKSKPKPKQIMELVMLHKSELELIELDVDDDLYSGAVLVSKLDLPPGTTITMINRQDDIIAPRGNTPIHAGDTLYILLKSNLIEDVTTEIYSHFSLKSAASN